MPTIIAKKVETPHPGGRAANKASVSGKVHYVTNDAKCLHTETQGFSADDLSLDEIVSEIEADVDLPKLQKHDLTAHYVISWKGQDENDQPRPKDMIEAGKKLLRDLGYSEHHKAVFAIHQDTDHAHLHIVACRVDPLSGKILHEGWYKNAIQKSAAESANRFGWDLEPRHTYTKDGERLTRQERRKRSEAHPKDIFTTGSSWQALLTAALDKFQEDHADHMRKWKFGDLHKALAERGIEVKKAANPSGGFGLVYSMDGEHWVKASKCAPDMTYKKLVERMNGATWRDMRPKTRQTLEAARAGMPPPPKAERKPRRKRQPRQEPAPTQQQPDRASQRVSVKIGDTSAHISGHSHLPKDTILIDWAAAMEETRRFLKELQGPDIFSFEVKPFELSYNPDRKRAKIKPIPPEKTPWFDREAEQQRIFQERLEQNRLQGQIKENQSRAAAFRNFHEAAQKPAEQPPAPPRPRLATERGTSAKPAQPSQPARPKKASPPRQADDDWKWQRAAEQRRWMRDYFARLDRDAEDVARLDKELEEQRQISLRLLRLMQERGVLPLDQEQQGETMEYDDDYDDELEQERRRLEKLDFERRLDDQTRLDDEKRRLDEERRQEEDAFLRRLEEAGVFQQASKPENESDAPATISNSVANDEIPASFLLDQPQPAQEAEKPDRAEQEREKKREQEQLDAFKKFQEEQEHEAQADKEERAAQVELHIIEQEEQAEKALGEKSSSKEEKQTRKSQLQAQAQKSTQQRKRTRMR